MKRFTPDQKNVVLMGLHELEKKFEAAKWIFAEGGKFELLLSEYCDNRIKDIREIRVLLRKDEGRN